MNHLKKKFIIRLQPSGLKDRFYYKIVVTNATTQKKGFYFEKLGFWGIYSNDIEFFFVNLKRISFWLYSGALLNFKVAKLLSNLIFFDSNHNFLNFFSKFSKSFQKKLFFSNDLAHNKSLNKYQTWFSLFFLQNSFSQLESVFQKENYLINFSKKNEELFYLKGLADLNFLTFKKINENLGNSFNNFSFFESELLLNVLLNDYKNKNLFKNFVTSNSLNSDNLDYYFLIQNPKFFKFFFLKNINNFLFSKSPLFIKFFPKILRKFNKNKTDSFLVDFAKEFFHNIKKRCPTEVNNQENFLFKMHLYYSNIFFWGLKTSKIKDSFCLYESVNQNFNIQTKHGDNFFCFERFFVLLNSINLFPNFFKKISFSLNISFKKLKSNGFNYLNNFIIFLYY